MQILRRNLLQAGLGASLLPTLSNSYAQSIDLARIVSGFPAGSSIDALGRVVAKKLIPDYARNVIVDTRPGAAGQIAVQAMKSASSDGSTILLTPMTVLGVYPHTYKSLPYDPVADLTPVSNGVTFNYGLAVGAGVPASITSIPQLMEWFKENPSKASLGNPAVGSTLHFAGMLLGRAANVDLTHVGYVNGGSMFNDVAGGVLPACISTLGSMMSFHNSGKLRIIGTTGAKRSAFLPNIPTFVEVGYKDLVFKEWIG